jgi:hypothetical protein
MKGIPIISAAFTAYIILPPQNAFKTSDFSDCATQITD